MEVLDRPLALISRWPRRGPWPAGESVRLDVSSRSSLLGAVQMSEEVVLFLGKPLDACTRGELLMVIDYLRRELDAEQRMHAAESAVYRCFMDTQRRLSEPRR